MDFDKDRQEKINLAKKKLKKFRKYHNVSSGEASRDSLNTDSTQSQSFSIPTTPNVNTNISQPLSPLSFQLNSATTTSSQNNTISSVTNDLIQPHSYNTNTEVSQNVSITNTDNALKHSNVENVYSTNLIDNSKNNTNIDSSFGNAYQSNSSNNISHSVDTTQNNYYTSSNNYSYQTNTQNSYYPIDNTGNNYSFNSVTSNIKSVEEKKPEPKQSIRSGFSGFVGSMFKNIIDAAAPPIAPEYLQKYKSSHNSSANSLEDENDNGMGNNYLVSNKSNSFGNSNSNDNTSTNYYDAPAQNEPAINEEPEYMKNLGSNTNNNSTPLFIQNSSLVNSQTPPPTSALAPTQYIRSMPKKKKKWAAFTYNEDEIVVDRENYSKNPANAISLKDYMNKQQQSAAAKSTNETNIQEVPKSNSFVPPKPTIDSVNTNMFVPAPPKMETADSSCSTPNILSPPQNAITPNSNASFNLSPNVGNPNINNTPTSPPKVSSNISSTIIPPPPKVGSNISSTVTPPPPKVGSNISSTVTPPPPKVGSNISSTVTPPPPKVDSNISSTITPPPPMTGSNINSSITPPPPMMGTYNIRSNVTPPPKVGSYRINATPTPPPKSSAYPGFSVPTPSYPLATSTYGTTFVPAVSNNLDNYSSNNQVYNTATVIQDEKEESLDKNDIEDNSKVPSVMGIIEENDNILLSSPHIDSSLMRNHNKKSMNPKLQSKTSFSSLIKNPDVIELTSSSNVTTPIDKSEVYSNTNDLFNPTGNEDSSFISNNSNNNDTGNENLSDILLNNHYKGKKKTKKYPPLADIMASPFGVHPKVNTKINENTENKLNEVSSVELEPVSVTDSTKNENYSETVSPDDTSSIFGVTRKSNEVPESSSLNQYFVPKDDSNDNEQSPSVVVKQKPMNDSLLFASNADGTNNNTNIMTGMQNIDHNDLPYNLIDDLDNNVNISKNNKTKKPPFNKDISLVSPEKLNEMSDIPLDENIPEKSTRQFFTSKLFSETAKAKNLLTGMFPIKDNKSEGSVGKLVNLAFNPHSENDTTESNIDINKTNETNDSSILKPSTDVKIEQNVLFTGTDNNENQGIFINQSDIKIDEKSNNSPLIVNTTDTPKQEQLFATPTEQRKTGAIYSSNIETASSLFGDENKSDNNQTNNEFMSIINQNNNNNNNNNINTVYNNIEFSNHQIQDNSFITNQSDQININNNNIPFYLSDNNNIVTNNSLYNQEQNNSIPVLTTDNSVGFNDIYNQNSSAKFYISSENATPINSDMYNNSESSFPLSSTTSPIKNEIMAVTSSNSSTPLRSEVVNEFKETNSQTISPIRNEIQTQNENIPFFNTQTTSSIHNESIPFYSENAEISQSTNQNEAIFFNNDNQNESFPTFISNNQENISFYSQNHSKNEQDNNLNNTNNQIPLYAQTENSNTLISYNNEKPITNVFDTYENQNIDPNTNVNFFDSGNQGGNWFEQFSQNNEPLNVSNNVNNENIIQEVKEEKIKSPKSKETEVNNELKDSLTEKKNQSITENNNNNNNKENIIDNNIKKLLTEEKLSNQTQDNKELLKLKEQLEESNKKLNDNESLITEIRSQIKEQKEQNCILNNKLVNIENENKENKEKIKQNEKTIDYLNSLIKMKDQQIDLLKEENDNDSENKDSTNEINKINDILKEKIEIIEHLNDEKQKLVNENSNQKQLLETKENELNTCQNKIKELNNEINRISSSSEMIENKMQEFSSQIQELQLLLNEKDKQNSVILKEKQLIESTSKEHLDKLEESKNSYLQLQNNCNILQEEIKKSKEQNALLEQQMLLMKSKYEKEENNSNEEKEFIQKIKEIYPNLSLNEIIKTITNLSSEKEVAQPKPIDPSKTSNIQELNWNEMGGSDNKDEFENYIKDTSINAFTPQPMMLPMNDEQIKKYEIENRELKEKCSSYEEAIEKNKAEIEYLKGIINNQKPSEYAQLADENNGENHSLIEIISQLTKDNQALSLQIQELRHEVDSNNQIGTTLGYSNQPYENINSSSSFSYPSYIDSTQTPTDLMYNQMYTGGNISGSKSMENKQGLSSYSSYGNIIDNRVFEQPPEFDMNYYDNRTLNSYTTPSSTFDHQQLLNQLDEREKNERNKMLASTSITPSQTDLLYKYNSYNY